MQPQHQLLVNHLAASSWHQLVALLAAHQLPRAAREQKAALVQQLAHHLTQPATIAAIVAQLTAAGKDALRQLLTADGALPSHTFETRYGPIRPFKPWRKDQDPADRQPWLAPISTTETLWYRGLIFRAPPHRQPGVVPHYVLPADLADLVAAALGLAPHSPNPAPRAQGVLLGQPGRNGGLDHHLAIWLATIHAGLAGQGVTPVHQRWLPPAVVALLCTRLGLDQDLGFTPIRSERHHPYLAFLHYLALAAELVAVTPAACQVTPTGWAWLTAPPATRQAQLAAAWRTAPLELARPFAFRWEPLSPAARPLVVEQLATQVAAHPTVATLIAQWRLLDPYGYLPGPRLAHWHDEDSLYDPLTALITGPLHWLGFITLTGTALTLDPATLLVGPPSSSIQPPAAACTMPKQPVNTILAPVTVQPLHLVQLAPFCDWNVTTTPTAIPHTFTLSPPRIAQLAAGGTRPEQLIAALAAAVGRPPSRRVISRIRSWAQPGQQLRLRPLLVLEADTPERLAQLRRYKLVRNRLGAVIAPNRISLNPADAEALAQTLRTLGYYVEPPPAWPPCGNGCSSPSIRAWGRSYPCPLPSPGRPGKRCARS